MVILYLIATGCRSLEPLENFLWKSEKSLDEKKSSSLRDRTLTFILVAMLNDRKTLLPSMYCQRHLPFNLVNSSQSNITTVFLITKLSREETI